MEKAWGHSVVSCSYCIIRVEPSFKKNLYFIGRQKQGKKKKRCIFPTAFVERWSSVDIWSVLEIIPGGIVTVIYKMSPTPVAVAVSLMSFHPVVLGQDALFFIVFITLWRIFLHLSAKFLIGLDTRYVVCTRNPQNNSNLNTIYN